MVFFASLKNFEFVFIDDTDNEGSNLILLGELPQVADLEAVESLRLLKLT